MRGSVCWQRPLMEALGSVAIGIIGIPALLITAACHGYHKQVSLSDTTDSDGL
jgi:hypothetical protein